MDSGTGEGGGEQESQSVRVGMEETEAQKEQKLATNSSLGSKQTVRIRIYVLFT